MIEESVEMLHAVVCEDPSRQLEPGVIVDGNEVDLTKNRRVALLPYDPEVPRLANTGWVMQHYGSGWLFQRGVGERGCPMLVRVTNTCRFLYWAARVVPTNKDAWSFSLRMVGSSDGAGMGVGQGMRQLEHADCQNVEPDERGGLTVYGKITFGGSISGFMFADFYCVSQNSRVKWTAITQHAKDLRWP